MLVYSKQSGQPRTPLTVRVEWLPDGSIKPLMYWTSDGICFKIVSQSESVGIAYLVDGGEGLRFKVRAEVVDPPEDDSDFQGTVHETYLYLAHGRYSQSNIIDARYAHDGKEYVAVTVDLFPDGGYEPVYFTVRSQRYMVERTAVVEQRGNFVAGGIGICHRVEARAVNADDDEDVDPLKPLRRMASLYLELNKWFVMAKAISN